MVFLFKNWAKLISFLLLFAFFSCSNPKLLVERGQLSDDTYVNKSLGLVVKYDKKKYGCATLSAENRLIGFHKMPNDTIDLTDKIDSSFIFFRGHNWQMGQPNIEMNMDLLNSNHKLGKDVKANLNYHIKKNLKKRRLKGTIEFSEEKQATVNGNVFTFFRYKVDFAKSDQDQNSIVFYKKFDNYILKFDMNIFGITEYDSVISEEDMKEFMEYIHFTKE